MLKIRHYIITFSFYHMFSFRAYYFYQRSFILPYNVPFIWYIFMFLDIILFLKTWLRHKFNMNLRHIPLYLFDKIDWHHTIFFLRLINRLVYKLSACMKGLNIMGIGVYRFIIRHISRQILIFFVI
jgi:hypothetical protein